MEGGRRNTKVHIYYTKVYNFECFFPIILSSKFI